MIKNNQRASQTFLLFTMILPLSVNAESLNTAWNIALDVDHSLKAVQQNTAAAQQQLEAAKAVRLPGVSLTAGYTALDNTPALKANLGGSSIELPIAENNSLSYNVMATLPLYTSGRISSGIDSAEASFRASQTFESSKVQNLKLKIAEAFVNVLRSIQSLEVADSHVDSLKSHASDVENLHTQGMVSRNDLLSAQVALADAQQNAIKAKNVLDIAYSAYNRFLNRPLNQIVNLDNLQPESFDSTLEALTEQALRQSHELLALQNQIQALRHQVAGIRSQTGPQLALNGGYGFQENQYQAYEEQWSINLGLQWKLFDGGIIKHKASATNRQAMSLQEQYDDMRTTISLQVRQYWLDIQETHKRIKVTENAIAQAEENLKVNRDRYENGLSTNTEVLDAESLRTRSKNNHSNALYDAVLAALHLKRTLSEL